MVQGVGFRFTTEALAQGLGLSGWVKNLRDGRVEVVCEGKEEAIIEFLDKIKNGPMKQYIRKAEIEWQAAAGSFSGFEIMYF